MSNYFISLPRPNPDNLLMHFDAEKENDYIINPDVVIVIESPKKNISNNVVLDNFYEEDEFENFVLPPCVNSLKFSHGSLFDNNKISNSYKRSIDENYDNFRKKNK